MIGSHGQSRSEDQKNRSEIKAIHAGPGESHTNGLSPQGAEKEPGQAGAEAGRKSRREQACSRRSEIRQMGVHLRRRQSRRQSMASRFPRRYARYFGSDLQ